MENCEAVGETHPLNREAAQKPRGGGGVRGVGGSLNSQKMMSEPQESKCDFNPIRLHFKAHRKPI